MHSSQFTPFWESTSVVCDCYLALIYSLLIRTQWFPFVGPDTGPLQLPGSFTYRHCPVTHCYPPGHGVRRAYSLLPEEKENASPNLVSSPKQILLFAGRIILSAAWWRCRCFWKVCFLCLWPLTLMSGLFLCFHANTGSGCDHIHKGTWPCWALLLIHVCASWGCFPFSSSALLASCSFNSQSAEA